MKNNLRKAVGVIMAAFILFGGTAACSSRSPLSAEEKYQRKTIKIEDSSSQDFQTIKNMVVSVVGKNHNLKVIGYWGGDDHAPHIKAFTVENGLYEEIEIKFDNYQAMIVDSLRGMPDTTLTLNMRDYLKYNDFSFTSTFEENGARESIYFYVE